MRAGEAHRAEMRGLEVERSRKQLNRRCASIHAAQIRRAAKITEKTKVYLAPPNYSVEQLRYLIDQRMGEPCRYCGKVLTSENFEVDHPIPLGRGGQFTIENSDVITSPCNRKKGELTDVEFESLLSLLAGFPKEAKADVLKRLGTGGRMFR